MTDIVLGITLKADGSGLVGAAQLSRDELKKLGDQAADAGKRATKGIGELGGAFRELRGALAAAGISIGIREIVDLFRSSLDAAGGLSELSQQVGIGTDALQALQFQAVQSGVETEELNIAITTLTRTIGDAVGGQQQAVEAFRRLGVEFKDTEGRVRNTELVLNDTMEAIKSLKDPADRFSIAQDLMGRSAARLLPILANQNLNLDDFIRLGKEAGVVLEEDMIEAADDAADAWAKWEYQIGKAKDRIAIDTLPILEDAKSALRDLGDVVDDLDAAWRDLLGLPGRALPFEIINPRDDVFGSTPIREPRKLPPRAGDEDADKLAEYIEQLRFEESQLARTAEQQEIYNALHAAGVLIDSEAGREIAGLVSSIRTKTQAQTEDAEAQAAINELFEEGRALTEELRTPTEVYADTIDRLNLMLHQGAIGQETYNRALAQAGEDFTRSAEGSNLLADGLQQVGAITTQTFADAILNAKDFGDVLDGLTEQILQVGLQMLVVKPLMSIFEGLAGGLFGGGGGGLLSGLFHEGGIVGAGGASRRVPLSLFAAAPRFHGGGMIGADERPIIARVGEGIFTPQQMAAMGGNTKVVVNNYSNEKSETRESRGPDGGRVIEVMIGQVVARDFSRRGPIAQSMESTYGLSRRGATR